MTRRLVAVSLAMVTLAVCDACGSDGVTGADRSIVGRYTLSRVFDVPMPATVKDPGTQYRLLFRNGVLQIRPDSTFDLVFDVFFVDYPNIVIDGHHYGPYHWTPGTAKLELDSPPTGFHLRGTAGRDTVWVNLDMGFVRAPSPVYDYVFTRR